MTKAALGGRATRWVINRVKPEQASKVKSRMPTRLNDGEGCTDGQVIDARPIRSAGVMGMARREGDAGNGGDPFWTRLATSTPSFRAAVQAGVGRGHSTVEGG